MTDTPPQLAFADRDPTDAEVETLRLLLSTFQDGTGQEGAGKLPGWRDFERVTALTFGGEALEAKSVFDVLIKYHTGSKKYGLSCKSKDWFERANQDSIPGNIDTRGRAYLELSNSAGDFWAELGKQNLTPDNYCLEDNPRRAGEALIPLIESWHARDSKTLNVDINLSHHIVLLYSKRTGYYQLFQYPISLPNASSLRWYCPDKRGSGLQKAKHIKGVSDEGVVFEWYGTSGGQLKYYPKISDSLWRSAPFKLEAISDKVEQGLLSKAAHYFPVQWEAVFKKQALE